MRGVVYNLDYVTEWAMRKNLRNTVVFRRVRLQNEESTEGKGIQTTSKGVSVSTCKVSKMTLNKRS